MRVMLALAMAAIPISTAGAQHQGGAEVSVGIASLGLTSYSGGSSLFQFQVNQRAVAIGLFLSPDIAIEPSASVTVASRSGTHVTIVGLAADVPIYAEPTWGHTGWYVAPGVALTYFSADATAAGAAATQLTLRGAVGEKLWLSEHLSLRLSGSLGYAFATAQLSDALSVSAQLGLSVFLH